MTSTMTPDDWLTVRQAAVRLGNVSPSLVYKMLATGKLRHRRIEGAVRVSLASVDAYLRASAGLPALPAAVVEVPAARRRPDADDFTAYYLQEMDRIASRRRRRAQAKPSEN